MTMMMMMMMNFDDDTTIYRRVNWLSLKSDSDQTTAT